MNGDRPPALASFRVLPLNARMIIRDAGAKDAEEACAVLRRSITELCVADHRNDPTLLAAWLSNKTPETVAGWMKRVDASYLVAVDRGAIAAVGAVTDAGEVLLNYVSPEFRFRGASRALLDALEIRAAGRGATPSSPSTSRTSGSPTTSGRPGCRRTSPATSCPHTATRATGRAPAASAPPPAGPPSPA